MERPTFRLSSRVTHDVAMILHSIAQDLSWMLGQMPSSGMSLAMSAVGAGQGAWKTVTEILEMGHEPRKLDGRAMGKLLAGDDVVGRFIAGPCDAMETSMPTGRALVSWPHTYVSRIHGQFPSGSVLANQ
jgi:hypothetical protein